MAKTLRVPLQIDSRGGLAFTISTTDIVEQQITDIIVTNPYERIMNPNYGARLLAFIFSPNRADLLREKEREVRDLLNASITLATIVSVSLTPSPVADSTIALDIKYTISPSPQVFSVKRTITGLITDETTFGDVL